MQRTRCLKKMTMPRQPKPIRYGKPCMTNLPPELGREIFQQIRAMKPVDERKLQASNRRVLARLEKRIAQLQQEGQ